MKEKHKFEGSRKSGSFQIAPGVELLGELSLDGGATSLVLHGNSYFATHEGQDILGTFHDRSKVTLIDCVTSSGPGTRYRRGQPDYHYAGVFPHLALFGDEHITSAERKIVAVSFTVDDAPTIFHDLNAFGSLLDARQHLERIVEGVKGKRKIDLGAHPLLFYFSGKHAIVSAETVLGAFSAAHELSFDHPGARGIRVENTIRLTITFTAEQTVTQALAAVNDTLLFLDMVAGRPQNIAELALHLPASGESHSQSVDVYWCLPPHRREGDVPRKAPGFRDVLLPAGRDPEAFASVLVRWLERHDSWRAARARFGIASSHQNSYDTDRLVGAANMFDIMPATACPTVVPLSAELANARALARESFAALPPSPERDSVLSALGRIGKPALKQKIRSRVKVIAEVVGELFPELEFVTDQAVDCRNFYVHGTLGKFDYEAHGDQPLFFTDTLEFVFAASDLIDAGWRATERLQRDGLHWFDRYQLNYAGHLAALKKLLE